MPHAIRGSVITCVDNPFLKPINQSIQYMEDAIIVIDNGIIIDFGDASIIAPKLDAKFGNNITITKYNNAIISPGFIDCHSHYPQIEMIAATYIAGQLVYSK